MTQILPSGDFSRSPNQERCHFALKDTRCAGAWWWCERWNRRKWRGHFTYKHRQLNRFSPWFRRLTWCRHLITPDPRFICCSVLYWGVDEWCKDDSQMDTKEEVWQIRTPTHRRQTPLRFSVSVRNRWRLLLKLRVTKITTSFIIFIFQDTHQKSVKTEQNQ